MLSTVRRVYHGWWVVATSFALNAVASGVYFLGFAVFFLPITRDLQVGRAAASLPFSIASAVSVIISPLVGMAADRLGPARIIIAGGLLAGLGYLLLSVSNSYIMFLLVFVLIIMPGTHAGSETPGFVAVSRWFRRRRGIAFAVVSAGFATGGAAIVPLLAVAVQSYGWRPTAFTVGILIWAVVPPITVFLRRSPREEDLLGEARVDRVQSGQTAPDGPRPRPASSDLHDFTFRMALKTPTYWFMALSYGLRAVVWAAISVHLVAIMVWKSLDEPTAGLLVGAYSLLWIPAILGTGLLADRLPKHRIAAALAMVGAVGLLLLAFLDEVAPWQMLVVFALLAPNEGSWSLAWAMIAEQFGRRDFGLIMGSLISAISFFGIGAPLYAGWVYDHTQSYLWLVIPARPSLRPPGCSTGLCPSQSRDRRSQPSPGRSMAVRRIASPHPRESTPVTMCVYPVMDAPK